MRVLGVALLFVLSCGAPGSRAQPSRRPPVAVRGIAVDVQGGWLIAAKTAHEIPHAAVRRAKRVRSRP
jgi:hypothetical protein